MPKGEYLQYGGQAVIEGVMMRSPRFFAVACRAPNQEIVCQAEPIEKTWIGRQTWLKKPFLRGSLALLDAMALGIKALQFASNLQLDEEKQGEGPSKDERVNRTRERWIFWPIFLAINAVVAWFLVPVVGGLLVDRAADVWNWIRSPKGLTLIASVIVLIVLALQASARNSKKQGSSINDTAFIGAMAFGLLFGVMVFVVIPTTAVDAFRGDPYLWPSMKLNVLDGCLRLFIFLDYVALIGQNREIFRVFQYHGAEHKAINTLEAGKDLTLQNCSAQTRLHPRCGTSFVIIVFLISIVVFAFIPRPPTYIRIPLHIALLFPIAGIAYECIRFAGKFRASFFTKLAFWPGLATQLLTTREPNAQQVEVALTSLKAVMDKEQSEEKLVVA